MDPVYNYNVAKAVVGATLHFAVASTTLRNENFNDFSVTFYPNPTNDVLNINIGSLPSTSYTFSLLDYNGKKVLNFPVDNANLVEQISLNGLSKGMYLGILQSDENRITKKIIVN